jgi:MarR-like DNA-binding transcriptional regulator SgrR of sgrS sRNA
MTLYPTARYVLYRLRELRIEQGNPVTFKSARLADELGISPRALWRAIHALQEAGVLRRETVPGRGKSSVYRFLTTDRARRPTTDISRAHIIIKERRSMTHRDRV